MSKPRNKDLKLVWIYGWHAVQAAINNPDRIVYRLMVSDQEQAKSFSLDKSVDVEVVNKQYFSDLFGKDAMHQNIAALVKPQTEIFLEDMLAKDDDRPIVILDQITDPHNIGAILRSAAVFDVKCMIVPENNTPNETAVLAKTASGALEIVPIVRVINLARCIKTLKENNYWCIGLDERGTDFLNNLDLAGKFAFIVGSEGSGMRRLTKESCDILAKLPVSDNFSTLNAAQACTVTLYESFRQRHKLK